jgi:anti-anti-sigma factor
MNITDELLDGDIYKISLSGRMDTDGVGRIETKLAGMMAAPRMSIIVDVSAIPFMASLGIRAVLMSAKSVAKRGGKFVLLSPQDNVMQVLKSSGIDQLVTISNDLQDAISKVKL